ncbi:MAG TPA: SO2930 family diheme c-type cytochrome [Kofleriaceae bacterium]|jgi:uncharacterized repeat protein (TIGR03806 family)
MFRTAILAGLILSACGGGGGSDTDAAVDASGPDLSKPPTIDLSQPMPKQLSAFGFEKWDADTGKPTFNDAVVPYDINTPLFSDYAVKYRAIYVPPGASAAFAADGPLAFPVGSVLIKNFVFPADLRAPTTNAKIIETRLLVHYTDGWQAFPYVWNDEQTDAELMPAGGTRSISFLDKSGVMQTSNYLIPQKNQCSSCHTKKPDGATDVVMTPIGPSPRQLHRTFDYGGSIGSVDQLTRLSDAGFLTGLPALGTITPEFDFRTIEDDGVAALSPTDLDRAARDYLDANCAHCHNPNGTQGVTSQLFLNYTNTDLFHLGECKEPGSAGLGAGGFKYDIVPGNADISILAFRITTTQPGAIMPLLGRSLVHTRGTELIRTWINQLAPSDPVNCGLPAQ